MMSLFSCSCTKDEGFVDLTEKKTSIEHFHRWRRICRSFVFMFTGLFFRFNVLLDFPHGSEVRKALLASKQKNIKFGRYYERSLGSIAL